MPLKKCRIMLGQMMVIYRFVYHYLFIFESLPQNCFWLARYLVSLLIFHHAHAHPSLPRTHFNFHITFWNWYRHFYFLYLTHTTLTLLCDHTESILRRTIDICLSWFHGSHDELLEKESCTFKLYEKQPSSQKVVPQYFQGTVQYR